MTQEQAFSILNTGANVFLTGEPGSGKTHTINRYVEYLRTCGIEPAITASTGIAATHIGGMTIHSWSGIGIRKTLSEQDLDELSSRERLVSRINRTHVLIIDEISMLDGRTLDSVEAVCRTLKRRDVPWGGMQVVFVGDFFQLPPVARFGEEKPQFAFLSQAWQGANPLICYLSEQHRQEDTLFLSVLTSIRNGLITPEVRATLSSRNTEAGATQEHTRLYSHNVNVDKVNDDRLSALAGDEKKFAMESHGGEALVSQLKRGCLSPELLRLKIGARVMFTKNNFEEGFVNGTMGEVEKFSESGGPLVRTKSGNLIAVEPMEWTIMDGSRTLARVVQFPLRLAWAMTVHKSQGATLDSAIVDLSQAFEYGQGYVAISRVRAFAGLYLTGFNERSLQVHPEIIKVDGTFRESSEGAEEVFGKISPDERLKIELNFITVCGGKIGGGKKKRKGAARKARGKTTYDETLAQFVSGSDIDAIAKARALTKGTILSHLEELVMRGKITGTELARIVPASIRKAIPEVSKVFKELGSDKLSPAYEKLNGKYSYDDLRLVRLAINARVE
ncbi:MAG: hypothetical protein A3C06_03920 [Candidatus Taylorbacteria bacterium RIFCSPHIGHO2_02_FULL_46_13]|uniref:AAA+ ATPase domain-containing protein n=1 Tax=Candidatus Taylorbacteria bacterium RIFCSPHIGHO2_02_FULL_46_13 TaxID=1802312 RepID=A0A1G2MQJ5_9BACT|nr:MAG: hypothetical protein A3C06_03920 [Candidatus Taylorbacteria bacterium RIFCSPHIGHO2_02_FULL_46_13]